MPATKRLAPLHKLPRCPIYDRNEFIMDYVRGKRVLHLGCAAWPNTEFLHGRNELVHQQINGLCDKLAGIDISVEGLDFLARKGFEDLHRADLSQGNELAKVADSLSWKPDVLLAGEFLEHLGTPGPALQSCVQAMDDSTRLVLTVPNAIALKAVMRSFLGIEKIPDDHVSYYSYPTLKELLRQNGLTVEQIGCYRAHTKYVAETFFNWLLYPLMWLRPHLTDGLIVVAKRSNSGGDETEDSLRLPSGEPAGACVT